ncbi:laccase, putative [Talaromyces stipitatus ATCC 10500]|uniref:Laccase, putative n=1 Tax=Talaromyces stipitatus (strain ATCC 10500 / CBS 375.48 / QM 6759 / NRRL 1006) TaxID=441959 RepID=B8MDT0_TALSN|nr:laccase, putative [Talaromyces stipitatus ATCC 10500]EED18309.1 laccase, putative [Talaromyces stipitatus ATCC 10500]
MQRRLSKRQQQQDATKSPDATAQPVEQQQKTEANDKRRGSKTTLHTPSILIALVCILPFLATVVLFVRYYYESNNDDSINRLSNSLHDHESISSTLKYDNRIHENGRLRPEDHIHRGAITQTLNWSVTAGQRRPDGVDKRIYLINDMFPGPSIEARSGDTLQILVHNNLEDEQISLHWHGLNMRGANTMDGVIGVTQCGIQPGQSFWYNFTISETQSGTFWYHAHSAVQRADGLYGSLVVHRPDSTLVSPNERSEMVSDSVKYGYDKEIVLMIGDWYHRTATDVASWYLWWGSMGYEPVPDSLLVNGAGRFNCSRAVRARPLDCIGSADEMPPLILDGNSSYRVRVVNTGSLTGIILGFAPGTSIQVITIDGGNPVEMEAVDGGRSSVGILFPGQRVDFVLRPLKGQTSWMTVKMDDSYVSPYTLYKTAELSVSSDFTIGNPALVPQQSFPIFQTPLPSDSLPSSPTAQSNNTNDIEEDDIININTLPSTRTLLSSLPPKSEQTHIVYTKVEKLSRLDNIPHGFFNRTTWKIQSDPPYPLLGLPRNQWDKHQFAVSTGNKNGWVDLVVNNLDEGAHPFHLHGYNFYVVDIYESPEGSGRWGSYNPWTSPSFNENIDPYDLTKAVLRDTVQIPRRGYAVLRFKADNPGVWLFHCHVMWHLAGGMAMVIDSGSGDDSVAHEPWLAEEGMECRV